MVSFIKQVREREMFRWLVLASRLEKEKCSDG